MMNFAAGAVGFRFWVVRCVFRFLMLKNDNLMLKMTVFLMTK